MGTCDKIGVYAYPNSIICSESIDIRIPANACLNSFFQGLPFIFCCFIKAKDRAWQGMGKSKSGGSSISNQRSILGECGAPVP